MQGTCELRMCNGSMHETEANARRYEAMRQAEGRVDVARISPKADEGGLLGDAPAVGGGRGVAAVTTIGTDTRHVKAG